MNQTNCGNKPNEETTCSVCSITHTHNQTVKQDKTINTNTHKHNSRVEPNQSEPVQEGGVGPVEETLSDGLSVICSTAAPLKEQFVLTR